ncbi:chromosome segregation protein SMC [Kosmotoga arenicorallina S304]|uniref:Chromosome partition protein Smc n=1 Tax=Kosmotoga arenicorallina S304 TaxID=1453497 RepID=A0A176K2I0_9BACT|nr:chromosome segregation protein SMC [Kosmotoga arenicorallina]OAA31183.1 chromosome segregation protein SMC [Kosmotoga arenicorallina S304]
MKLKSLYIRGFKSFAFPTKMNVDSGITAIVGPNGSGKSNIVDAIRWLFGEQSMKSIRADNREDVIFAGSEKNPPANVAEVKLIFETQEGTITVGREVSREGLSNYLLNNKPARLKDIKELFKGTGVGRELYSIVGQGQVDKVITASPYELRSLLEEAAGTAIYREKKKEALSKLAQTESNLERVEDILFELGKQRKSLYLKAKRAEKYLEYKDSLVRLNKHYYGNILRIERETLKTHEEERERISEELKKIQRKLIEEESRWSTLRQEFSEMDKEIESFTQLLEEYKKRQNDLLELKEMYSRRLSDKENKLIEVSTKLDSLKEEIHKLDKRKEELKMISDSMLREIEEKENQLKLIEQERDEIVRKYSEKEKDWLKEQEKHESLIKRINKIEAELEKLEGLREDATRRLNLINSQIDSKNERYDALKEEIEGLASKGRESSEKQKELEENISSAKEQLKNYETELEELKEKSALLSADLRKTQIERTTLERQQQEYQGFSRAVREVFTRRDTFENLVDVVANVIDVPEAFETAITVLLGGHMQDIVVEDSNTAKRIVEFLKMSKIGRATLLPLDLLQSNFREDLEVKKHPGFLAFAAKAVRVNKKYSIIPEYLFGNAIIVRNLDDAIDIRRKTSFRGRIASVDGQLLSAGGSITGGYLGDSIRSDLIARKRKIQFLVEKEKDIQKDLQLIAKEIQRRKDDIMELRGYLRVLQEELNEVVSKGATINRMMHELLKTSEGLKRELEELNKLKEEYTTKLNFSHEKRESLTDELQNLSKEKSSLEEHMASFSEELKKEKKKLENIQNNIIDSKLQLASLYEKKEQYSKELTEITMKKRSNQEEIGVLSKELNQLETDSERLRKQVDEQNRELESLKKETQSLFDNIRYQREGKEERFNRLQEAENGINALKEQREKKRENMHQMELLIQETKLRIEQILKELEGVDTSDIPELTREEIDNVKTELDDVKNKLKFLGTVDLDAIEEYKLVDADFMELSNQKADLEKAKEKLSDLIEKTDNEARTIFMETYEKINASFARYIEEIFDGGIGEIKLMPAEDILEAGVEISVKRPGRKFQKLQLMSGGEKALVGIALVFALLSIKPSPFYVLDEVDAPLDDFNAERFRRMLNRHAEETQFLVITHNKIVMEAARVLHGITMTDGVSKIIPVEFNALETIMG